MGQKAEKRAAAAAATWVASILIAQQVAGKAVRDAFFLSNWPAENLPLVMALSSVLSVAIVLAFTRLVVRHSPARIVPGLFALHALLYLAEWGLSAIDPALASVSVYVHSTAVGATVVSGFWSVINESFDPHTAKRFIGRIAGGATAGGVIGGVVAWQVGQYLELSSMLLVLVGLNLVACYGITRVTLIGSGSPPHQTDSSMSGRKVMREVPYLRQVAALVIAATMLEACIDYVFKAEAKATLTTENLITFFAIFHTVIASGTFLLQTALARRSLQRLGLAGTVATLPATNILGAIVALLIPGLWPIVALRGSAMAVENSLYRSGYELLYTPLSPARKRPTKTIIDVAADRFGTTIGSGLALAAIWFAPDHVRPLLLSVAIALALLALVLTGALHKGYVSALVDSLRAGSVELRPEELEDATTKQTLADTAMALDREKLLEQIAALRKKQGDTLEELPIASGEKAEVESENKTTVPVLDEVTAALAELRSGHPQRIKKVLGEWRRRYPATLVPSTIELLARDDLHREVIDVLRPLAEKHVGQLCDALLDRAVDFAVRRRIPRVLGRCRAQRSVDGLTLGLYDERFEVRYRCGLALYQISSKSQELVLNRDVILDAALRESERGEHVWRSQKLLDTTIEEGGRPFEGGTDKVGHSLEHVFTILSLVLEREPLLLAYRALATADESLRGTGLEYLENVLPANIRKALWPFLDDRRVTKTSPRAREEVVKVLLNSMSSMAIDLKAVRRAVAEHDDED